MVTLLKLRPFLLILAISLAIARTKESPRYLRIYLIAELVSTAGGELAYALLGWASLGFAIVYCIFRSLDLLAAFLLGRATLRGLLFGAAMLSLALAGTRTLDLFSTIALVEGACFFAAGASLAFTLGYYSDVLTGAILSIAWILLGVFDMGYGMYWRLPFWQELNTWWPSAVCILAFALVAIFKSPLYFSDRVKQGIV